MTRQGASRVSFPIAVLLFATAGLAAQSDKQGKDPLSLPVTSAGGTSTGTFSINRFELRGSALVAIGRVRGSLAGTASVVSGAASPPLTVDAAGARAAA